MSISLFEAGMLICFGTAWPLSIIQSIKSKSTKGKSIFFLFVILIGYTFGILHKINYSQDFIMALYILNFIMVLIDIILYFINSKREKEVLLQEG